jgi:hypothetical protein
LITFADTAVGHDGTLYRACNWVPDGKTNSSYEYIRNGYHYDKRLIYRYAKSVKLLEHEFADLFGFEKLNSSPKNRFIMDLN